ncbi:MAG TPA: hypothetical protein VGC99_27580 [Candidatus Tectomicrobia bacterium]
MGQDIAAFDRLQLICRGNAFFPLEYVYGGQPPKLNAEICPNATPALHGGGCGDCPYQESTAYLCPLHFWGYRKVIERHGDHRRASAMDGQLPYPSRDHFGSFRPVLFAAADRAFKFRSGHSAKANLEKALEGLGGHGIVHAKNWDDWTKKIAKRSPNVLVLIPHIDKILRDIDVLEIGSKKQLGKHEIDASRVGKPETIQLLLLLGCAASASDRDLCTVS